MFETSGTDAESAPLRPTIPAVAPLGLFGDDALAYRAIILLSAAACVALATAGWLQRNALPGPELALAGAILAGALLCQALSRRGRRDIAAALLIAVLWFSAVIFSFQTGFGMHTSAIFILLCCTLFTTLFFGPVVASAQVGLTISALWLMYKAEQSGQIGGVATYLASGAGFNYFVGIVATNIGTLVLGTMYHRRVESEAARVVAEAEYRRLAMEEAQRAQARVETAHARLAALSEELQGRKLARARRDLALLHAALADTLPAALGTGEAHAAELLAALRELALHGSRPLRPEALDLTALAHDAIRAVHGKPEAALLRLEAEPGLSARGDRAMVAALLLSLLTRAARACAGVPAAEVRIGGGSHEGAPAFFVRDNGQPPDPAHMFEARRLADGRFDASLALARCIAERHGGELRVDVDPGGWTTVTFTLPG